MVPDLHKRHFWCTIAHRPMESEGDPKKARLSTEFTSRMPCRSSTITTRCRFEARWITLGADVPGRILVVVYTWRSIRARLMPGARRHYVEGL